MLSSSLTSVNLHGLTRLELVFAVLLVMGSTGLILALGLTERRRNFAILDALGAKSSQLGAFIWSEGLLILLGGGVIGTLLGFGVSQILVKVLTGVFDPPPEHLYIPWGYMAALAAAGIVSTVIAIFGMKIISRRPVVEELRTL
jgi:putative ABC transport system permease protein